MQVAEILCFDQYYNDRRFSKKKPVVNGTWRQRCGDNIYYRNDKGEWKQHHSTCHRGRKTKDKDLKHPYVFIAEHFYYFGSKAINIPSQYEDLIWRRQGCKCNHNPDIVNAFLRWLETNFRPGIRGNPHSERHHINVPCFGSGSSMCF